MPLREAARAACVSHTFLQSWRCCRNLTLSKETLGLNGNGIDKDEMARDLISKVDGILKNHSGVGMKKLELNLYCCRKVDHCYLNSWLRIAFRAGIEELSMLLSLISEAEYNFPCSLLFSGSEKSIRYLKLSSCVFRPTAELDCWRRLKELWLTNVLITDDELECLLSNSSMLELLWLFRCNEIVCVKIPCQLQRLSFLRAGQCRKLQEIESNAQNISSFDIGGSNLVKISFGGALRVKNMRITCSYQPNVIWYTRTKPMPSVLNVETLHISSCNEMISTPTLPSKFLHLKYLHITLNANEAISPAYDYLSLVSFLVASPCLETFIFVVQQTDMKHDSIVGDISHLRQLPEHRHDNLKSVTIVGFCSAKSMVELTLHIIKNTSSLQCLTLDTSFGSCGCSVDKPGGCNPMRRDIIEEAHRALLAIRTHVEGIIPSRVMLNVSGPCSRCHVVERD
ncbi:hypothetical protein CFC21_066548 [Triticum aestivum]|uniref:At1g61320/AtMIF1 LRR domain-containing protein n=3 Tax=Triticum TaxID=4564 RepID=A0A9R0TSS8_TRITD|nr:uncharacterized protein LOC123104281 isoform X1 [Triticum aestivum]KAF7059679.1 hypothetical protein CFC21_066548 [Triticum aestivum]VAI19374.1 unnamed protein product [Triticum turgidum subsp. durum]